MTQNDQWNLTSVPATTGVGGYTGTNVPFQTVPYSYTTPSITISRLPMLIPSDKFTILPISMVIHARGKSWSIVEVLSSSQKVRWIKIDDEIAVSKYTMDVINMYVAGDGYADLDPHEFIDKVIGGAESAAMAGPK